MKKQLLLAGFILSGTLTANAQNVASTTTITSGGLEAGSNGQKNTFYGYRAGKTSSNSSEGHNSFFGHEAGLSNNTGTHNVFVGTDAGRGNISGTANVFIGDNAGGSNINESGNVCIGSGSGANMTGNNNTYIGHQAGMETIGSGNVFIGNYAGFSNNNLSNSLIISNTETDFPLVMGNFSTSQLKLNGKVGIGSAFGNFPTTAGGVNLSNYNLFVKGGILTEEVRVNLQSAWADYVFQPEYQLPTLIEVEKHIQEKGRLMNVPSATQIAKEGIAIGEMLKIQQEKIEELTLYIIEQNKTNEKQAKDIEELKKLVNNLTNNK